MSAMRIAVCLTLLAAPVSGAAWADAPRLPPAAIAPSDNPIMGAWQLIGEADLLHIGGLPCATGMVFAPGTQTVFVGRVPYVERARYARNSAGMIVVYGINPTLAESGLVPYIVLDADHMNGGITDVAATSGQARRIVRKRRHRRRGLTSPPMRTPAAPSTKWSIRGSHTR